MTGLELAYGRARDIIGPERAECLKAAVEVERLRLACRPDRVRVVVLAESHVWTSRGEIRSRVLQPNGIETGFARFVYCLGYGEPQLVEPAVAPNLGTHQFWRLFHDTVHGPTIPHARVMKAGEADSQKRVLNKLDLLYLASRRERHRALLGGATGRQERYPRRPPYVLGIANRPCGLRMCAIRSPHRRQGGRSRRRRRSAPEPRTRRRGGRHPPA
jgi:hypothetical protein